MDYLLKVLTVGETKTDIIYATKNAQGKFEYCSIVSSCSGDDYHQFADTQKAEDYITGYWKGKDFFQTERYQRYRPAYRTPQQIEEGKRAIAAVALIREINAKSL